MNTKAVPAASYSIQEVLDAYKNRREITINGKTGYVVEISIIREFGGNTKMRLTLSIKALYLRFLGETQGDQVHFALSNVSIPSEDARMWRGVVRSLQGWWIG